MGTINIAGREFSIDDDHETIAYLAQFIWWVAPQGYALTKITQPCGAKKTYGMHRIVLAMNGGDIDNPLDVDHINRIRSDNRRSNLRWVTKQENALNAALPFTKAGRFPGVSRNKDRWQVVVRLDKKTLKWLGIYDSEEEAARVAEPYLPHRAAEFAAAWKVQ